jgi:hypothetical protein
MFVPINFIVDTAFKQQRLKAWQPLLTPKTVLPTLFAAGIVLAPLGGLFLYESETVSAFPKSKAVTHWLCLYSGQ